MSPETKQLLDFIASVGMPGALLLVMVIWALKVTPTMLRRLRSASRQSETLALAIPDIQRSLHRMAEGGDDQLAMLRDLSKKMDTNNEKLDTLIKRS